jgi:hypothetical protein
MIGLGILKSWWKEIALALAVVALGFWLADLRADLIQQGRDEVTAARDRQDRANNEAALVEQKRRDDVARKKEDELRDQVRAAELKAQDLEKKYEAKLDSHRLAALAGTSGMRCPTAETRTAGQAGGGGAPAGSAAAGQPVDQGGTALLPQAADAVLVVAADSARLVRKTNRLIDEYNRMRAVCNSSTTKEQ